MRSTLVRGRTGGFGRRLRRVWDNRLVNLIFEAMATVDLDATRRG